MLENQSNMHDHLLEKKEAKGISSRSLGETEERKKRRREREKKIPPSPLSLSLPCPSA